MENEIAVACFYFWQSFLFVCFFFVFLAELLDILYFSYWSTVYVNNEHIVILINLKFLLLLICLLSLHMSNSICFSEAYHQEYCRGGLPWWRSGWESACQCRGHGFEPWSGKIPHAAERLGPWATTTEPARLEPVLRNKRGRDTERPAHCDEEWPPLAATRESPRTETKTQTQP